MCYSAQVYADYRKYRRHVDAKISIDEFYEIFRRWYDDPAMLLPKGMVDAFRHPQTDREREIAELIDKITAREAMRYEQELFQQRTRKADAERKLAVKHTKAASESLRIASNKIERALGKLEDLRRTEPLDRDSRIYPGWYCPVLVMENGQRVIRPMRYQCRIAGKPANYDQRYPGTYNARRDNLQGFWRGLFGHTHGLMVVNAFFENVSGPEGNVVLKFQPRPQQDMLVACLWSRWTAPGEPDLLSFAALTDEPPAEVAAAGHDRCIVPIRPENIDAWLSPDPARLADQYAILDDRERPYYEHRLAA